MIAHNVYISDNDGHPLDPERRLNHDAVNADEIKPVIIGNNVWIGAGCVILKGAEIGDNTVVSPNSVISAKALPNKIMMGNPARAIKTV
jgi:acetyltransferase-like isoleucine patch superfamily enzyme